MSSNSRKPRSIAKSGDAARKAGSSYKLAAFVAGLTFTSSAALLALQHLPNTERLLTQIPWVSHAYSFTVGGVTARGRSRAPFEKADGYYARVEACESYGIETIFRLLSCHLTIRPTRNLTISNSLNATAAVYDDGRQATICCMYIGDRPPDAIYRIKLPAGMVMRRTFQRGSTIQVTLNIPDADLRHDLDAVSFSPGEGVAPVLFPLRDRTVNKQMSARTYAAHRDDPRVQALVREGLQMRARMKANEAANRGLTYSP